MRELHDGDIVLHFYNDRWLFGDLETRISGYSIVNGTYREIRSEPPSPGDWANMSPYYRVDLRGYTVYPNPLSIHKLLDLYSNEIRREIIKTSPRYYPFYNYDTTVRTVQGMYIARCTVNLYTLINDALGIESSIEPHRVEAEDPQRAHSEGLRLSHEGYFWARNPRLVREAKEHYGFTCQVCGFNFQEKYGHIAKGYIECHHLNPLSERLETEWPTNVTTTINDVRVVCAYCHRVIHRYRPALSIDQLISAFDDNDLGTI
jgi:hypothetical protein